MVRGLRGGCSKPKTIGLKNRHMFYGSIVLYHIQPYEMPDIDPSIACNHVNVDAKACYVSQHQRRQSLEKDEATTSTIKYLLDTRFISEAKYIEWLSNFVFVKKASG